MEAPQKPNLTLKFQLPKRIPLRLGYACINQTLGGEHIPKSKRVCINNGAKAVSLRKQGMQYAIEKVHMNLDNVMTIMKWNEEKSLKFYRMSSDMFPHITNPEFSPEGEIYAYDLEQFREKLEKIGQYARDHNHRITFHPDQFNNVGTPDEKTFIKTKNDLTYHADVLDIMGMGPDSVMIIHGGGTYGEKDKTMERWVTNFFRLPENVRNRIVIENCEEQYSALDMLELSKKINRPVVFDTLHHACYHKFIEQLPEPSAFLVDIIKTWEKVGVKPKFHISEQDPAKKHIGAHSEYVEEIPEYLIDLLKEGYEIDLMIEAKKKEWAVQRLYEKYGVLKNGTWYLK